MMIHKINPSLVCNKWLKRLDIQLNEPTNQNSLKVPKVANSINKKTFLKTLGTSDKQSNVPSLPVLYYS